MSKYGSADITMEELDELEKAQIALDKTRKTVPRAERLGLIRKNPLIPDKYVCNDYEGCPR